VVQTSSLRRIVSQSLVPILFCSQFSDDGDGGGGADAVGSCFEQGLDVGQGANAAGGLDPQRLPATPRMRAMSATVAPPPAKPVEVLMKSAPAWMAISEPRSFSSMVRRDVSRITLSSAP